MQTPNTTLTTTAARYLPTDILHALFFPDPEPVLVGEDAPDEVGAGLAMGEVGLYVTLLISAATWKTEPPPYS